MADKARPSDFRELEEAVGPRSIIPEIAAEDVNLDRLITSRTHVVQITPRIAPWWSKNRDVYLWETLLRSDLMSSAINVTTDRLFAIPFQIVPKDKSNRRDREMAYWSTLLLQHSWAREMFKAIVDWQTQDNGMFLEILGAGDPGGQIEPTQVPGTSTWLYGLGFKHLDSQRATRTGDPEYPVRYRAKDDKGRWRDYRLHRSRVLFNAQMESGRDDMLGVGFCGVSRCISHVLHMTDIQMLKEEWLGSRPVSEIIFGPGLSAAHIEEAFRQADEKANADGQARFAKVVFLGLEGNPELVRAARLERISLKRLPEGYDEEKAITVAINVVAMALGFEARTLWPATVRGATRADAEVQHLNAMLMTQGVWERTMITGLEDVFCPNGCSVVADLIDDAQDAIVSDNKMKRVEIRSMQLQTGQIDLLVSYQQALEYGDITEDQFNHLVAKLEAGEIVDPSAPKAEPATSPGQEQPEGDPEDGDDDGIVDEGSQALEEMFRVAGVQLASEDKEAWIGNGKH